MIDGKLTLTEIAPGVDLKTHILDQMEFTPAIAEDLKEMDPGMFEEQWGKLKDIVSANGTKPEGVLA